MSEDMYDEGYNDITNCDISKVVIESMKKRNLVGRPEMKWDVMDIRKMEYEDNTFDLVIDKSTIDAVMCGEHSEINAAIILKECQRILKPGGRYVVISYGKPESRE